MRRPAYRLLVLGLALMLCCACGRGAGPGPQAEQTPPEPGVVSPFPRAGADPGHPLVFVPEGELGAQETIRAYFDQHYRAYGSLQYIDVGSIADMGRTAMANSAVWLQSLTMRRRLLKEQGLCYVETRLYPYTLTFVRESALSDPRVDFWAEEGIPVEEAGAQLFHFVITGEEGRAYPPFFALNAQHTMCLQKTDGVWKITAHYFPGSARRFPRDVLLPPPDEALLLARLRLEFGEGPDGGEDAPAPGARPYDGALAASYARMHAEHPNPAFYAIGDWLGNCANFTSQCIWWGFGGGEPPDEGAAEPMTPRWYGGRGGGTLPWENVACFWDYAAGGGEMEARVLPGAAALAPGDLVQVRAAPSDPDGDAEEERFHHSLLVVDADTLLLAQNSPNCFVYYSDLVNTEVRMLRPVSLPPA